MKKFIVFVLAVILIFLIIGHYFIKQGYITIEDLKTQVSTYAATINEMLNEKSDMSVQLSAATQTITELNIEITELNIEITEYKNTIAEQQAIIDNYESEQFNYTYSITDSEIDMIAKTVYGEARGLNAYEQSLVIWCILNRVDEKTWGSTITKVITAKNQFHGYSSTYPVTEEIRNLVEDVVIRWQLEKEYGRDFGRTLPKGYTYFHSSNGHNAFYTYINNGREYYAWSDKPNPYQ